MEDKALIVYICNNGYAYQAMDEARRAGARGGLFYTDVVHFLRKNKSFLELQSTQKKIY